MLQSPRGGAAVGDFDAAEALALIKKHFGDIPRPAAAPPPVWSVPWTPHAAPRVLVMQDPETTTTTVRRRALPFLDGPLPFHCLSLTFHCLSLALALACHCLNRWFWT